MEIKNFSHFILFILTKHKYSFRSLIIFTLSVITYFQLDIIINQLYL